MPKTHAALMRLADTIGTPRYAAALRRIYPHLENISVDYAISNRPLARARTQPPSSCFPPTVGWSDIGSWAAVYELLLRAKNRRAKRAMSPPAHFSRSMPPEIFSGVRKKFVAAIGVQDLVVVETPDALLICPRERAQDVGQS